MISLDIDRPIWNHFFLVHPLLVVGTRDDDGHANLAPKHMAIPLGWENYFAFVCSPTHSTYTNIERDGVFTVTYPRPDQVVLTSLSASPRCEDRSKPVMHSLPTMPAQHIDSVFLQDGYVYLECEHVQTLDGFGPNSLIIGRIVAAHVSEEAMRSEAIDDSDVVYNAPLLAYLQPGRFAAIARSNAFPFPASFKR